MENFNCIYCEIQSADFDFIIEHVIDQHEDLNLKIKVNCNTKNGLRSYSKNFNVTPSTLKKNKKCIIPVGFSQTIKISKIPEASPLRKIQKISNTPSKSSHSNSDGFNVEVMESEEDLSSFFDDMQLLDKDSSSQTDPCIVIPVEDESQAEHISDIVSKIPDVLDYLHSAGKTEMYQKCTALLADRKLPLSNIAFLLFCDVVEWFSLNSTRDMRYSEDVKQFWHIGLKLFKGKFLRFMSGWKNKGQEETAALNPAHSVINFAVPSRSCLEDSFIYEKLKGIRPGVLDDMIRLISENDVDKTKTFKLCVDGKKINIGLSKQKYGDVNLWGLEGPPSLEEREHQLETDNDMIIKCLNVIEKLEQKGVETVLKSSEIEKKELMKVGKDVILMLSKRLQELRIVKQAKTVTLEKVKSACTNEQMKSKYSYAISAIKTFIYRINVAINRLLKLINIVGEMIAVVNGVGHLYEGGSSCDLSEQENYICLTGPESISETSAINNINTSVIKQRSDAWHMIRNRAVVTGSTCHSAIGLRGLKGQKEHFECFVNGKEKTQPSEDVMKRMQHGTDNEINGVATIVSKVLPIYQPNAVFVEEGCEVVRCNDKKLIVVSPDGSVRKYNEHHEVICAVEIKCPFPGKLYTTPVYYTMPWYYVCQVLLEMFVLKTKTLMFVCYSEESSTIFEVPFNDDLWTEIYDRVIDIYGTSDPVVMKRLPPGNAELIDKLKVFCKKEVNFIAEVPSVKVRKTCNHQDTSSISNEIGQNGHKEHTDESINSSSKCLVIDMMTAIHEIKDVLLESHDLCRHLASEVLVFLISDLDRVHEREKQYAVPVAYALKGYSLTSAVLRQMLNTVLKKCFEMGLYVPAISFDGQWSKLAVRSQSDFPLTTLQLQKDVFKEAKSKSRKEILDAICMSNCLQCTNMNEVFENASVYVTKDTDGNFVQIDLHRALDCDYVFHTTSGIKDMLKGSKIQAKTKCKPVASNVAELLDNIVPHDADLIEHDVDILQSLEKSTLDTVPLVDTINDLEGISGLFENDSIEEPEKNEEMMNDETNVDYQTPIDINDTEEIDNTYEDNRSMEVTNEICASGILTDIMVKSILTALVLNQKTKEKKWQNVKPDELIIKLQSEEQVKKAFTKNEIQLCLQEMKVQFAVSWNKDRMVALLYNTVSGKSVKDDTNISKRKTRKNAQSLKSLSFRQVKQFSKQVLSCIYAESIYKKRFTEWQNQSAFSPETHIDGVNEQISWYSMPEYIHETFTYLYALLDCHHLFVNARVKCCSSGIKECGLKRNAWRKVAENSNLNGSGLSLALVDDLVDKQNNAYAQKTFSVEVENAMRENGDAQEADFCKLIREWYAAEDEPGIEINERIKRRLRFREWLLKDVQFDRFPPPGTHVKGIPHVMFEGILTNIERRIQIIPHVKSGALNPRALGSLEAENFFGEFQELDPRGSGVIKPDDIPKAIGTACELISARHDPKRKFYMDTSRAKVYPFHQLIPNSVQDESSSSYMTPSYVTEISPRNHLFDQPLRAARKHGKRKSADISKPAMPCRGIRPVRAHHKCDESKILPHIRLGINLPE